MAAQCTANQEPLVKFGILPASGGKIQESILEVECLLMIYRSGLTLHLCARDAPGNWKTGMDQIVYLILGRY